MSLNKGLVNLPPLKPNGREREFNSYSEELKAEVIYEHLFNAKTHRWLDKNVLGITHGRTNGRVSANILYYLGMKADYRGIFKGVNIKKGIKILENQGEGYYITVKLLKLHYAIELSKDISKDISNDILSEEREEGKNLEGEIKYYYGKRYERSKRNRELAIKKHGLNCVVCGFNYERVYGMLGKNFIEVHHIKPLSTLNEEMEVDPENDLVPLCANCHRMIHRKQKDILSIEELKNIVYKSKNRES